MQKILSFNVFDLFLFPSLFRMLFWAVLETEAGDLLDQDQVFANLPIIFCLVKVLKLWWAYFDVLFMKAV